MTDKMTIYSPATVKWLRIKIPILGIYDCNNIVNIIVCLNILGKVIFIRSSK